MGRGDPSAGNRVLLAVAQSRLQEALSRSDVEAALDHAREMDRTIRCLPPEPENRPALAAARGTVWQALAALDAMMAQEAGQMRRDAALRRAYGLGA